MASENGWEPSHAPADLLEWRVIPGTNPPVHLQFMKGWPSTVMTAYAADYNAYIEPLRDADSASFTPTNSVATSNHLNGTAMDLNWDSHPFRVDYAGFDPDKIKRMRELLAFYNFEGLQIMFWAQDWRTPKDAMHHQMGYDTWNNPKVLRFIEQRIRADGFSTYKRGGAVTPPPPPAVSKADGYALAIIAEGRRRNVTPRGIQIALSVALVESGMKMYANSKVPESMNIPHDAVGTDHDSVGLFQQRCPMWGPAAVLMDPAKSAGLFYDRLVKLDYNGSRPPGDYAADVQRPAAQYRGRYQERMGDAVALYNRLAGIAPPPPQGDEELSAEAERKIDVIYQELTKRFPSRSPLRHLGEGLVDTVSGFVLNVDGSQHVEIVTRLARYGDPDALALLREVAGADPNTYPDRRHDAQLAQAILAEVTAVPVKLTVNSAEPVSTTAAIAPQVVYVDRPAAQQVADVPAVIDESPSTGQIIGRAYDALEALRLADALPIESRAPLAALISVLSTKNGSQL